MNNTGIEWTDYTWNVVGGCRHDCTWTMPDGSEAICYAHLQAESPRLSKFYPKGFRHHYWHPQRLQQPLKVKKPSRIFLDSMSDLMGAWVPDEQIQAVLDTCRKAHWHTFQLLTKNAPRLLQFDFPPNVWVGASVPPSNMHSKPLSQHQQERMLAVTLGTLKRVPAPVRWMSIEPLSWDVAPLMQNSGLQWVVIGAASNGAKKYQPRAAWVAHLLAEMDAQSIPVFFKGNLEWQPWREDFPQGEVRQLDMFQQLTGGSVK